MLRFYSRHLTLLSQLNFSFVLFAIRIRFRISDLKISLRQESEVWAEMSHTLLLIYLESEFFQNLFFLSTLPGKGLEWL